MHYIKTAWRNLRRNPKFTILNVAGLTAGMASALLIALWLQNMLSFDRTYKNEDRLYVMCNRDKFAGEPLAWRSTPLVLGPALLQDYPEVEAMARYGNYANFLFTVGDKKLNVSGAFADTSFFKLFNFQFVKGKADAALNAVNKIVLTQKFARTLFGNINPLGKAVKIGTTDYATVSGVLKDLPNNTSFKFDYLLSMDYAKKVGWTDDSWTSNPFSTFILLKPNVSEAVFDAKVRNITIDHTKGKQDASTTQVFTQPMSRYSLYNQNDNGQLVTGRIVMVKLFSIVAVFILIIACINFMNLSTARSEKRAKEVGVKKVIGAKRRSLVIQFLVESILLSFVSFLIALVIVWLSLPFFNRLVQKDLSISFNSWYSWLFAVGFVLFTGLLAGSYPAFYLSSFQPLKVLKGTFRKAQSKVSVRSVLVVLQFSFSIILIIATITVAEEIKYAEQRDKGYNQNGLLYSDFTGTTRKNYSLIRNELLNSGAVTSVTKSVSPITERRSDGWGYSWTGSEPQDSKIDFLLFSADADFVKTMNAKLIAGRDIDIYNYPTDSNAMLLTESAVKAMRLKNPIGTVINNGHEHNHVVGIVKDFVIESPFDQVKPMLILGPNSWFSVIHYRLNPARSTEDNLAVIRNIFKKYNPDYPFEYHFTDQAYANNFKEMQGRKQLAFLFAGLSIFISCLGLFGLVAFIAETRTKEIGIRKVLGASVFGITSLLSKNLLKLVVISFIVATPFALYLIKIILDSSTYRVNVSWWWFAFTFILAILIAMITISSQAIKAARVNPVKSLKTE